MHFSSASKQDTLSQTTDLIQHVYLSTDNVLSSVKIRFSLSKCNRRRSSDTYVSDSNYSIFLGAIQIKLYMCAFVWFFQSVEHKLSITSISQSMITHNPLRRCGTDVFTSKVANAYQLLMSAISLISIRNNSDQAIHSVYRTCIV